MLPGQSTLTINLSILDLGQSGASVSAGAFIFGCWPVSCSQNVPITILHNDPLQTRDPANILGTTPAPTDGDPLQYAKFTTGMNQGAVNAYNKYKTSNPSWAAAFKKIAYSPGSGSQRFWYWNQPLDKLANNMDYAFEQLEKAQPNTVLTLTTYALVHGGCSTGNAAFTAKYLAWMQQYAAGIGNYPAVVYLEEDSLITSPECNSAELAQRMLQLKGAIALLEADPHTVVYIDAGAADDLARSTVTNLLKRADVCAAQGFFLNSTHFDWTSSNIAYGQAISNSITCHPHFVVNTGTNGRGPLVPSSRVKYGNEWLCNPLGRGTGPLTVSAGYRDVDGLLWFNNVGNSAGDNTSVQNGPHIDDCPVGSPPTSVFWPQYAAMLVTDGTSIVNGPDIKDLVKSTSDE
jgi:hypothetical protein